MAEQVRSHGVKAPADAERRKGGGWRSPFWMVLYAAIGAAIGAFFAWLAFREQDWQEIAVSFRQASLPLLLLGLALVYLNGVIRAYRWRLLFVREQVSVRRLYMVEHAGIGANSISPVRLLAEPVQFGLLTVNDRLRGGDVLASLSLQRSTDLLVTFVFVGGLILTVPAFERFALHIGLAAVAVLMGGMLMLSPFLLIPLSEKFPRLQRFGLVQTFRETARIMGHRKARIGAALVVGAGYWLTMGVVGWVAARAVGIDQPFHVMLAVSLATIFISTSVPGLPAAIGTFELAAVFLLGLWDVPREQALLFGLVFHVTTFLVPISIAAVVLPREGVRSFNSLRSMVERFWQST